MYDPRKVPHVPEPSVRSAAAYGAISDLWHTNKFAIVGEFQRHRDSIAAMDPELRASLKPSEYWRSVASDYPRLYRLGLWWSAVQTSSVAAERSFGVMRHIEADNRKSMGDDTWHAETFMRCNKWIADEVWKEAVASVPSPLSGVNTIRWT
jgi:hAT family C-terminal dimerisation region